MTKTLTQGNPAKLIFFFAMPLIIGNIFQQFYSMADTLIVGRTIGVNALAAVGCTGSITFFIIGFVNGLTSGLSIITAQKFGSGNEHAVRKSFAAGILISVAAAIIFTILAVFLARPLLELLQTPNEIIEDAYAYLVIVFMGIPATILFNLLSNIVRALGDSKTPLYFFNFCLSGKYCSGFCTDPNLSHGRSRGRSGNHTSTTSVWNTLYYFHCKKSTFTLGKKR